MRSTTRTSRAGVGEVDAAAAATVDEPAEPERGSRRVRHGLIPSADAGLRRGELGEAVASDASWAEASWTDASWAGASWSAASWADASWSEASWTEASWNEASWTEASWTEASWTEASQVE